MSKVRPLSVDLKSKAHEDLGETVEKVEQDLRFFKDWVQKIDHMSCRTDDQFLIGFLRGSKFNMDKAKKKLDLYYKRKLIAPEIFPPGKATNPQIIEVLRLGVAIPFPETQTPDGPRIVLIRTSVYDPSKIHISKVFQMAVMMNDILMMEDDNFVIGGLVNIIDMKGVNASQLSQFTPTLIEKILFITQEALPVRQRGFHFLNLPMGGTTAINLFKGLFNARNQLRADESLILEAHGNDVKALHKFVGPKMLPKEYGGDGYTVHDVIKVWEAKFEKYRDYFIEDEKYGYLEGYTKMTPIKKMDGVFRSLNID